MRTFISVMLFSLAAASESGAQQEAVLRETCGEPWRIETRPQFRIGGSRDPERLVGPSIVVRDSKGRFIVYRGGVGQVFNSTGTFLHSFGRAGSGPGEYQLVRRIEIGSGDSIHVLDSRNARVTVLSPEHKVVRTKPLAVALFNDGVRLASDSWIVESAIRNEELVGLPLHMLSPSGTISRSFGAINPVFRADAPGLNTRHLAAAGPSRVLAAHDQAYMIELWDTTGNLVRRWKRDVEWFRPWVHHEPTRPDAPWKPRLTSIVVDTAGILWARVMVAKPNWDDYVYEHAPGRHTIREPVHQAFRIVLEALDLNRGCVLATLETDQFVGNRLTGGFVTVYGETPAGIPYLDVLLLRLTRDPARTR